jgi:acetyl-CoA carboxylase beta subunit
VCLKLDGATARFFYQSATAAGAVGAAQGESLLQVLKHLNADQVQCLCVHINSAGAHFKEPMAGLFYLNAFLEALWQLRAQGMHIRAVVPGWLYGGMAMAIAAVAQEIVLAPTANMGLLGRRVRRECQTEQSLTPTVGFHAKHISLLRCP